MADYDIGQAFKEIEEELIASMIRNLERHKAWEEDEGFQWDQWQVLQLQSLERYRRLNRKKFKGQFEKISRAVDDAIRAAREDGRSAAEAEILQKIKDGFADYHKASSSMSRDFFRLNDRKLNALIKATQDDMKKAEHAILRMANDQYRKVIFSAQVYANTGAGTYEKAVDMATKGMLQAGLNCIEYKNGARHTARDYADMAIKTASTRAYLSGEGEMRDSWGIHTVIVNKRTAACPKCTPFAGKIMIDDVYCHGSRKDGKYPLISQAIEAGFLHPRCKDTYTTYFPGLDEALRGEPSEEAREKMIRKDAAEQKQQQAERQAEKYERMAEHSLDSENRQRYEARAEEWKLLTSDYSSGPVMAGLSSPAITNSEEIVNKFMSAIEVPDDLDVIKCVKMSVQHMPPEDLEMIARHGLIIEKTDKSNAFINSGMSKGKDGRFKYVIKINPYTKEPFVFAHECAHFAEKINDLYHDPEFRKVLMNFENSITGPAVAVIGDDYYYIAMSDLLVEPYQGRTYIRDLGAEGLEHPVRIEDFVEYISDGYECFVGDPKLLEKKDPVLYNYFIRRGLR